MTKSQDKRWQAELEIIQKLGEIPSIRRMQRLLEEDFGIKASKGIIHADLQKDLETLSTKEYSNQKGGILSRLDNLIDIADDIAKNSDGGDNVRLKAMDTLQKLLKAKTDILTQFKKAESEVAAANKEVYNIYIGEPKEAKLDEN